MRPSISKTIHRALLSCAFVAAIVARGAEPIKVGIIGLDAHAVPWTQIIHGPQAQPPISDMRIVAAVPAPSADVPFSTENIEKNTATMREMDVEICGSIDELLTKVDAVMVLSIDGRPHPAQARAAFAAKKPVFIDKPVAASLAEAIAIFRDAEASGTPCFTNSALRYGPATAALASDPKLGRVFGCDAYSSSKSILPAHPDLFYYGIHGCETLFAIMGSGCESVTRVKTETADLATGVWKDGRLGTFRGILQGQVGYGATVFGEKAIAQAGKFEGYETLLAEIARFFKTGKAPVSPEQTLELYAFLEAADESLRQGGRPVTLASVLEKAQRQANAQRPTAQPATPAASKLGQQRKAFRAGAAATNITPELDSMIIGGFVPFPASGVHDELHARCLVLDDGRTKLALVVCDLLGLHRSVSIEARRLIEDATGIPPSHVAISATHTHSAASVLGERYTSEQPLNDYERFVARRIADGVRRALNNLRPAQIAFGTAEAPEHVFNRRWFMKEGTVPVNPFGKFDKVKMNPPAGSPNLTEPAGPTDPTVSFIALREPDGRLISVYSAYSLHYVGGVGNGEISADYFGMFCDELMKLQNAAEQGPPFVPMMANGTSGDINNINFRTPRSAAPPYTQMRKVAEDLAGKVSAALAKVEWKDGAELDARFRELDLSWRPIDAELLAWAKEKQANPAASKGDLPTIYAGRVLRLAEAKNPARIPLQILRIGDICIGTFPCETFAETGLEFKRRSPFPRSFMVELNHGYFGYLPTPRHFELGGYETWPGTNSLEREAAVKMLDALLDMAAEMTPKSK